MVIPAAMSGQTYGNLHQPAWLPRPWGLLFSILPQSQPDTQAYAQYSVQAHVARVVCKPTAYLAHAFGGEESCRSTHDIHDREQPDNYLVQHRGLLLRPYSLTRHLFYS